MNVAILMGRLTRDPELKYTSGGKAYTTFTLAVQKTRDEAEFIDCVVWEKTAESVNSYEQNGEKRKFTRVLVNTFEFIDSKNNSSSQNGNRNHYDSNEDESFPFW